jgi:hypothetical protein
MYWFSHCLKRRDDDDDDDDDYDDDCFTAVKVNSNMWKDTFGQNL